MSLYPGMKFKFKKGKKTCTVKKVEGNEIQIKCGKRKPYYINKSDLEERVVWSKRK